MLVKTEAITLLAILKELWENGSWCGETHLQKAMFFLEEKLESTSFEFTLYKHGPYSFELHDSLSILFSRFLVEHKNSPPYGPRIILTESGKSFLECNKHLLGDKKEAIDHLAHLFGNKGVSELEKLATAQWLRSKHEDSSDDTLAEELHEIKPHIPEDEARKAFQALDRSFSSFLN